MPKSSLSYEIHIQKKYLCVSNAGIHDSILWPLQMLVLNNDILQVLESKTFYFTTFVDFLQGFASSGLASPMALWCQSDLKQEVGWLH